MPQWFDPLNDTPIGRLLKDVKQLSKAVEKKKEFPDLNNDGKTTFADILHGRGVGKKGKKGKKDEGYNQIEEMALSQSCLRQRRIKP